ncbi:hypothetical protein ACHQM5_017804 [Ranunculus cassubicifolius]
MLTFVFMAFLLRMGIMFMCVEGRNISRYNDYLESRHKPAIISIQTEYGDVYDCVDIYKQPAFDHPALKYHKLQVKPSSYPKGISNNSKNQVTSVGLKDGGCPRGTVPIRRPEIQDVLIAKSRTHFRVTNDGDFVDENHAYATIKAPIGNYYGARAILNVWQPTVSGSDSFSLSQIWLTSGPSHDLNTIEAGWIVYPKSFGTQTRHFVHWTADGYEKTGCYNTVCPGFVQVNQRIPVDAPLAQVSTYNGQQHEIQIDIFKDPRSGNWFLLRDGLTIGYWPSSIFNTLNTNAERVDWGGETEFIGRDAYPPMGSGHFPEEGYGKAAYIRGLQVIKDNMHMTLTDEKDCIPFESNSNSYRVQLNPNGKGKLTDNHLLFGGRGCRQP